MTGSDLSRSADHYRSGRERAPIMSSADRFPNVLEALRESEERLRLAVQASNVGLWDWDLETNQVSYSREWKRQLGYEEDEIGDDYREWEQRLHPEDVAPTLMRLKQTLAGQCPVYDVEFRLRHKDGSYRWIYARGEVYADPSGRPRRMMGCHVDITDRKSAEAAIRAADRQRAELIASIDGIVWESDAATFRFSFVSAQAERILGHPIRRWIDEPTFWVEHLHPEDRDFAVGFCLACTRDKRDHNFEYRMRAADGRYVWLHDVVTVVVESGRPVKLRGIMVDITARKQAEEERRRLEAQLQHTQKLESLGILAGGIAHDFNNLLTGILGYADLALLELPPDSPVRQYISEAANGARRAAELTRQMLAYSGKGRFVVEPLDLSAVVREMAPLLQISVSKRCHLLFDLKPGLPLVEADATQVRQVVMNLVINASEAIGEHDGRVAIATGVRSCDRAVLAQTYLDENLPEGPYVFLEVKDDGCGMSEETRARIFDPFYTTKFTGRGLGLSAVLGIVRGHRGAIQCQSEPGQGTTFRALFPASSTAGPLGEKRPRPRSDWRGSGTVLVVDDEPSVRGLARRMLETMGFAVLTAADGRQAVETVRSAGHRLRLVLLDLTMPNLDGVEALRELRRMGSDVKVVLSSGYGEQTALSRFADLGLAGFVQKPYRYDDLLASVRQALGHESTGPGRSHSVPGGVE